jgi:hypothetical protein
VRTPSLFDVVPRFDGPCYDPAVDLVRFTKQLARIFELMSDRYCVSARTDDI